MSLPRLNSSGSTRIVVLTKEPPWLKGAKTREKEQLCHWFGLLCVPFAIRFFMAHSQWYLVIPCMVCFLTSKTLVNNDDLPMMSPMVARRTQVRPGWLWMGIPLKWMIWVYPKFQETPNSTSASTHCFPKRYRVCWDQRWWNTDCRAIDIACKPVHPPSGYSKKPWKMDEHDPFTIFVFPFKASIYNHV